MLKKYKTPLSKSKHLPSIFMPPPASLKILSHKNVCVLTNRDRDKFLNLFFEELRFFITSKMRTYTFYAPVFASNQSLLNQIKFFMTALSHCRATDSDLKEKKPYAEVESYIFIIYNGLHEWVQKIIDIKNKTFISNIIHRLHLVIENFYAKYIKKIKISLPKKDIETNIQAFLSLQTLINDPTQTIFLYEEKLFKKEVRLLSDFYRLSTFSKEDTTAFHKDIFSLTQKYPQLDHEKLLEEFSKKIQPRKY